MLPTFVTNCRTFAPVVWSTSGREQFTPIATGGFVLSTSAGAHCESAMFVSVLPRPGTVLAAVTSVAGADLGVPEDRAKSEIAAARTAAALFSDVNFAIKACAAGTAEFVGASRRNEFNASIALSVSPEPAHASPIMISAPFAAPFPYCTAVCASARASSYFDCLRYVLASAQWASQFSASIEMAFCRIDAAEGRSPC